MTGQQPIRRFTTAIQSSFNAFFTSTTSTGVTIIAVTALALLWTNSPWGGAYATLLHQPIEIVFATLHLEFTFQHFVNDALMAIFFLVVGLEIKRELLVGELSSRQRALLPMIAAVMGMVGPAVVYLIFNAGTPDARGWGVPVATDIAFALGVLALLGSRVPLGLKVFLAALAIVDDLLAVLVIALFYTGGLNVAMLTTALGIAAVIYAGNRLGIHAIWFYALSGLALWVAFLFSGVHATIAGVVLAMCIPAEARIDRVSFFTRSRDLIDRITRQTETTEDEGAQLDAVHALEKLAEEVQSPLHRIEHGLSRIVSFGIMPLFALVNAGVVFNPDVMGSVASPLSLGVILGLFLGKQAGISLAVWASVKSGIARLPNGVTMAQMYGVSILCGIGFTMALFVANLAFTSAQQIDVAKISILSGSLLSAVVGYIVLSSQLPKARRA